jgi:hypothetical protein
MLVSNYLLIDFLGGGTPAHIALDLTDPAHPREVHPPHSTLLDARRILIQNDIVYRLHWK